MNYFENISDEELKIKIDEIINEVNKISKQNQTPSGFTIANTKKYYGNIMPYFPPIRETRDIVCGNVIIYTEKQAKEIAKYLDGKVEYIIVDSEKKILPTEYGINDAGNIELALSEIKKSKALTFKANDLTVSAIDALIANKYSPLGGRKVAIIGAGNIGSKIALTLLERGARPVLYRRNVEKLEAIVKALNTIKPEGTISFAEYSISLEEACNNAEIIIGCTPGIPIINKECVSKMKELGIIIDIGKGSIYKEAIEYAISNKIDVIRADIRAGFFGTISTIFETKNLLENIMGSKAINGIQIASGGIMAKEGTVIVDNYKSPKKIIGISNGCGDFKRTLSDDEKNNLEKLKWIMSKGHA